MAFSICAALSVALVGLVAILNHEMWRDELQIWLLARDSESIGALLGSVRYEGHPPLWYSMVRVLTVLFKDPMSMQILHFALGTGVLVFFFVWAPVGRALKLLFGMGYYPLYEYMVISRSYVLVFALLFVFCMIYPSRHRRFLPLALVVLLLDHTHVFGLIAGAMISIAVCGEVLVNRARGRWIVPRREFAIGVVIIAIGFASSVISMVPPADSSIYVGWDTAYSRDHLKRVLMAAPRAFFPIPTLDEHFWNHYALENAGLPTKVYLLLGLVPIALASVALAREPAAWVVFTGSTAGYLFLYYARDFGFARHFGFLFMVFVAAMWIAAGAEARGRLARQGSDGSQWRRRALSLGFAVFLVPQAVAGLIAVEREMRLPFSNAKAAAAFIANSEWREAAVVGDIDYAVSPISAFLGRPVFYPRGDRMGSFMIWNEVRVHHKTMEDVVASARKLRERGAPKVLLVLTYPAPPEVVERDGLLAVTSITGSVVGDEDYYMYALSPEYS